KGRAPERAAGLSRRVLKFGGTSVTGASRLDVIERVVRDRLVRSDPIVVVSAMSGITETLRRASELAVRGEAAELLLEIETRHRDAVLEMSGRDAQTSEAVEKLLADTRRLLQGIELLGECSPRTLDQVLSLGERLSVHLVAGGLRVRGVPARVVDAAEVVVTDENHVEAEVDFPATEEKALAALAADGTVPIVTGFLGASKTGDRTTLGKGGSDYTAAVLGWAVRAEEVEIWTDVPGVMTADPRVVPDARPLRHLGFSEVLELSHWGAKVVHQKTVRPCRDRGIPLSIRNTMSPDDPGTLVTPRAPASKMGPVRGIASIDRVALFQLSGVGHGTESVTGRFLHALDEARCPVLLISQGCSERSVCVALPPQWVRPALRAVEKTFALERRAGLLDDPSVEEECSIVAVVGEQMKDTPGIAGKLFGTLGDRGVSIRAIAQGSSELNISFVVRREDAQTAVRAIHEAFFGSATTAGEVADEVAPVTRTSARDAAQPLDVVGLATELLAIPSLSGHEHAVTDFVIDLLTARGWEVRTQPVSAGRRNVWATHGRGEVTLSTHLDTVPVFLTPRLEDGRLYGRGACDAKGIAAAMICAAQRLAEEGEDRVDLLLVMGEELRSDGARAAAELPATSAYLVNGEPTESKLVSASKGSLRLVLRVKGQEAHSAYPELGRSAVEAMVALLSDLRALELPSDPVLGETTLNVGTIRGGSAANVFAGECEVECMIRLVGDAGPVKERIEALVVDRAEVVWGSHIPPQRFHVLDGFETTTVAYTSDVPILAAWGEPLMFGPGSIHHAHTEEEHVSLEDLRSAVDTYVRIARALLAT
ncbi:MAG TPA: aspartate kinase, partial [Longimicrobiales bacterium]|nr:aspartate kinase [Longimicrobiales bacterium]